jgi:two-component system cell cycle sensor histidine kinase PleC
MGNESAELLRGSHLPDAGLWDALERMSCGVCYFDRDDRLVVCNQTYRALFPGLGDLLLPGTKFEFLITKAAERGIIRGFDGSAEDWVMRRLAHHRSPGEPVDEQMGDGRVYRLEEARMRAGGVLLMVTDVTRLVEQERALAHRVAELEKMQAQLESQGARLRELAQNLVMARDEAERANRTKSEFLANMSHELRSPLNAIIGFAEIMKDQLFGPLGTPQYKEYSQDIWSSGTHLLELINDILDLSKIEAGKLDLQEEEVNIRDVVDTCVRLVANRAQKGEIKIHTDIAAEAPKLWADERKLKQILLNLLSNAVKFTRPGGTVSVTSTVAPTGDVVLRVIDTGIGIAANDIPKALAAFGQVDSSLSRKYEGTGLGLPLTKALVELHGGTLTLESQVNVGTTVCVSLPAVRARKRQPAA